MEVQGEYLIMVWREVHMEVTYISSPSLTHTHEEISLLSSVLYNLSNTFHLKYYQNK